MSLGELVTGTLLGKALAELLKAILEAKQKNSSFQPALARLESTLKPIIPRLDQINRLNKKLSIKQSEMEELVAIIDKGKVLVVKCRKLSTFNVAKKAKYSKELLALDSSIERYFNIILPLDHFKDTKEILMEVKKLSFFFLLGAAALIGFHLINGFHFKKHPFFAAFQKDEDVAKGTIEMSFQQTGKVFMKIRAYLGARNILEELTIRVFLVVCLACCPSYTWYLVLEDTVWLIFVKAKICSSPLSKIYNSPAAFEFMYRHHTLNYG